MRAFAFSKYLRRGVWQTPCHHKCDFMMAASRNTVHPTDPDFDEICLQWYNEVNSDISGDESEDQGPIVSDHRTDSEQEINENEEDTDEEEGDSTDRTGYYYG